MSTEEFEARLFEIYESEVYKEALRKYLKGDPS